VVKIHLRGNEEKKKLPRKYAVLFEAINVGVHVNGYGDSGARVQYGSITI
jgi:hypothetical protein